MSTETECEQEPWGDVWTTGWYWTPVLAYCGLIFFLSSQSFTQETLPSIFELVGDKILHMIEYGILGILCYRGFRYAGGSWSARHAVLLGMTAAVLYGISDEVHQSFVPLREADPWDLLADTVGAVLSTGGWHWASSFFFSRSEIRE